MMAKWQSALGEYRRRSLGRAEPGRLPVLFVLCSEDLAAASLASACDPTMVLQTLGGAKNPRDEATRATLQHAVRNAGVRHVVVCGHEGCKGIEGLDGDPRKSSQTALVAQCRALVADPQIGALLREHRVRVTSLWFDEPEGDVFHCSPDGDRVELMSDREFAQRLGLDTERGEP